MANKKKSVVKNIVNALGTKPKKISPDVLERLLWDAFEYRVVIIKTEGDEITRIHPHTYEPKEEKDSTIKIISFK